MERFFSSSGFQMSSKYETDALFNTGGGCVCDDIRVVLR